MSSDDSTIMIVDDDAAMRRLLRTLLENTYQVYEATCGEEAIELALDVQPALVLLDIMMTGMDGYETCQRLKTRVTDLPPQVIMVSSNSNSNEQARAFEFGADDYLVKPIERAELKSRVELNLRLRESQKMTNELREQVDSHHEALRRSTIERMERVIAVQDVAVLALAKVAESRDNDTGQHIIRMRDYAYRIAHELGDYGPYMSEIDAEFLADLYRSSPLHDIGKVGISDAILLKPGRLTRDEFEEMKRHAVIGADILNEIVLQSYDAGFLAMAAIIARFHHERWDGKGYPAELRGTEIPLAARIVSVADVYDALTTERPYKKAWPADKARATIVSNSGAQFDPTVVDAFEQCFDDILAIQNSYCETEPVCKGAISFLEYDLAEATC